MVNTFNKYLYKYFFSWVPVYTDQKQNLAVMSIGFLLNNRNSAVVWRGPKKTSMVKQFLNDVCWGDLDYLIIDTPPGIFILFYAHFLIIENIIFHHYRSLIFQILNKQIELL